MSKKQYLSVLIFCLSFIIPFNFTVAQFGMNEDLVKIKSYQSFDNVYPGSEFKLAVKVNVDATWHINSNKPYEEFLIPSELSIADNDKFVLNQISYPEPHDITLGFSDNPLSVWEGETYVGGLIKVNEKIEPGTYPLVISLDYQACNDNTCLAPTSVSDTININVVGQGAVINEINQDIFQQIELEYSPIGVTVEEDDDDITSILEENGIIIGLIFVFIGGLALNLTPCVYPLIPITIGYFGGQSEGRTSRLFMMGLLFVLGLALTYSVIGVVTSLSGSMFGALLQNTYVILFIVLILLVLSLSMFGVYEFKLPDSWVAKAGGAKGGYYGAFFMGLTMGIVAAPCIGPFVIGLVTYVAAKGDPFFGFIMFFVLALGLGLPYLFLAMFSGKIKNLPKAGEWMDAVKHIFGFILVGMALYFLLPLLPDNIAGYVLPVYAILIGIYLLFFEKLANNVKGFRIFKIVFSIIIIAVAVYSLIPSDEQGIEWTHLKGTKIPDDIQKSGVIIDFYADWCIPCKELDAMTFSDPTVVEKSQNFLTFKADLTKSLLPEVEQLKEKYKIVGVPTVLILNSDGVEVERITGFVNAEEFLKKMESVK